MNDVLVITCLDKDGEQERIIGRINQRCSFLGMGENVVEIIFKHEKAAEIFISGKWISYDPTSSQANLLTISGLR